MWFLIYCNYTVVTWPILLVIQHSSFLSSFLILYVVIGTVKALLITGMV